MGLEAPRATGVVERRVVGGFREVKQGGTWIVKESYDVTSGGVRRLFCTVIFDKIHSEW